eukprot:1297303-Pyramimonas_sp.AAC.1
MLKSPWAATSIFLMREHHADAARLADVQHQAARAGFTGLWAAAPQTDRGGTFGGMAILAPA